MIFSSRTKARAFMVFCYQNCSDLPTVRKNCSSDGEKLLKFEAEGRESGNCLRSLEQFILPVKGQTNFYNRMLFNLFLEVSQNEYIRTIRIQIGKNNFDLETYRKVRNGILLPKLF